MGVTLPSVLVDILDLIGVEWPNVDEDILRDAANTYRTFASQLEELRSSADAAAQDLRSQATGKSIEAFGSHWEGRQSKGMQLIEEAAKIYAEVLDAGAIVIEVAKGEALVQLFILLDTTIATQAAAIETLGASEAVEAAAIAACRTFVKEVFKKMVQELEQQLIDVVKNAAIDAAKEAVKELAQQGLEIYEGKRSGFDLGAAAEGGLNAGKGSLEGGLQQFQDPNTYLNAATNAVKDTASSHHGGGHGGSGGHGSNHGSSGHGSPAHSGTHGRHS